MSGKFIVFEGVDNSGKTTVATQISDWLLNNEQINTLITKHPGSTPVGQEIRTILKHSEHPINPTAQALLFAADNSMFINQILKPSINNGTWVIGDRNNFISSLAYQIASGCSWSELDKVHDATGQIIKIDLLIIFYCGWEESQRRKKLKKLNEPTKDRYEDEGKAYFEKLSNCYDVLISGMQDHRLSKFVKHTKKQNAIAKPWNINLYHVDASKPLNEVIDKVKNIIKAQLLQKSSSSHQTTN